MIIAVKYKILISLFVIVGFIAIVVTDHYVNGHQDALDAKARELLFDTAEINGRLHYLGRVPYLDCFSMESAPDIKYAITLSPTAANEGEIFVALASAGDSLIKHKYSDTIMVIKNNVKYYFFDRNAKRLINH
ncbi:MAG: hypothetical protein JWO06_1003 [Bacteroidota bacterium]|nr:hypothetical protein [Bacteroidota bacterium]